MHVRGPMLGPEPAFPAPLHSEDALVTALTRALERALRLGSETRPLPDSAEPASVFFSVTKPDISVHTYVRRLVKYAQCSPAAFGGALVYMDRLAAVEPKLAASHFNLHRLLLTSVCLAAKFLDDRCFSNAHYARVGGIASVGEMNRLELHLLKLLNYELFVSNQEYASKERLLLALIAPPPASQPMYTRPSSPVSALSHASPSSLVVHECHAGVHRAHPKYHHHQHPLHVVPHPQHQHQQHQYQQLQPESQPHYPHHHHQFAVDSSSFHREVSPVAINHQQGAPPQSVQYHHQPHQQRHHHLHYNELQYQQQLHRHHRHPPLNLHHPLHHQRHQEFPGYPLPTPSAAIPIPSSASPPNSNTRLHPPHHPPTHPSMRPLHRSRTAHDLPTPAPPPALAPPQPLMHPEPARTPFRASFAPCSAAAVAAQQHQLLAVRQTQSLSSLGSAATRLTIASRQRAPEVYKRARIVATGNL